MEYWGIVLLIVLASFTFYVEENQNMDFARFISLMKRLKYSDMSLMEFLKSDISKYVSSSLTYTYSFNTVLYFVSKVFKNCFAMVWISVLIDYALVCYIAYMWRDRYSLIEWISMFLICAGFLPFVHAVSGLRTATASCLMGFAIYRYLCKNSSIFEFSVISLIALTYHSIALFAIPIAIVVKLTEKKWVVVIVAGVNLIISRIIQLLSSIGGPYFQLIERKYTWYSSTNQYRASRWIFYGNVLFCICILFYFFLVYRRNDEKQSNSNNKIYTFLVCYACFTLGNIDSYEMVVRSGYLIGAIAPVVVGFFRFGSNLVDNHSLTLRNGFSMLIRVFAIVGALLALMALVYYFAHFFSIWNIPKVLLYS